MSFFIQHIGNFWTKKRHTAHIRSYLKLISYLLLLIRQEFQEKNQNLLSNLIRVPQVCVVFAFTAYPVWCWSIWNLSKTIWSLVWCLSFVKFHLKLNKFETLDRKFWQKFYEQRAITDEGISWYRLLKNSGKTLWNITLWTSLIRQLDLEINYIIEIVFFFSNKGQ